MALAAKIIAGVAAASMMAYRLLTKLKAASLEAQTDNVRIIRWVSGIMMALCKCIYEIVGIYLGNRPGVPTAQPSAPPSTPFARFGQTAASHEAAA